MFVMVAGRGQGKSVTAVRWLLEQPGDRMLLTSSGHRRQHLMRVVQTAMSGTGSRSLYEHIATRIAVVGERERYLHAREIGIDDAEEVLRLLFGAEISFMTVNGTLVPTFHDAASSRFMDGEFTEAEFKALKERKAIQDGPIRQRPIRDNPQG